MKNGLFVVRHSSASARERDGKEMVREERIQKKKIEKREKRESGREIEIE